MHAADHALIVIDLQNDFCPDGALAVSGGDQVVAPVNALMADFPCVVLTQDWHPADHSSFAVNQPGHAPFEMIEMAYGSQVLWPAHCIQGTSGAGFHRGLATDRAQLVIRKGFRAAVDSYSAFFENDHATATGLAGYLRERGVTRLTLAGLALDFCVAYSAIDAARLRFEVTVIESACRAIDLDGSLAAARQQMQDAGVRLA